MMTYQHNAGSWSWYAMAACRVAAVLCFLALNQPARAVPPSYPVPPPDFSHADEPHRDLYSVDSAHSPRPMLVIYVQFADVTGVTLTTTQVNGLFFGSSFPSVNDYYQTASFGRFRFTPARETVGTANDGVVGVTAPNFVNYLGGGARQEAGNALQLADSVVDFSTFDANGDGTVDDSELVVMALRVSNPTPTNADNCGATRSPAGVSRLDGVRVRFNVGLGGTATNLMTHIHEIGHVALRIADLYGYGVGALDISGPTCGGNANLYFHPAGYQKLHWGWITPNVVTRDGFYDVRPADSSGDAFVLYDPDRGTDDYFLIENRRPLAGTYEQSVSDAGLVIWRMDDSIWYAGTEEHVRPVELIRPDGVRTAGCRDDDVDGEVDEEAANGIDDDGDGLIDEDIGDDDNDGLVDEDGAGDANGDGCPGVCGEDDDGDGFVDEGSINDDDEDGSVDEDPSQGGCYSGSNGDAWDPSDPASPQRTMVSTWRDGTPSLLAVRAIWPPQPSDNRVRAYFDVRGPGVLIDTYDSTTNAMQEWPAAPAETIAVSLLVTNTQDAGEPGDTFEVTASVPALWSATSARLTLPAGESGIATIAVTPRLDAPSGVYEIQAVATSTSDRSIRSQSPFRIRVVGEPKDPDHLESNDRLADASDLRLTRHVHLDPRILEPHSSLRTSEEVWTWEVSGLNLHDVSDRDVFHVRLPDPSVPHPGHHDGIAECDRFMSPSFIPRIDENVVLSGFVTIDILSPLGGRSAPLNTACESIQILPTGATSPLIVSGIDLHRVLTCPRSRSGLTALHFSFGELRRCSAPRIDFPDYRLRVEYKIRVERIPANGNWLFDEQEARGLGVGPTPCPGGGFFPFCEGNPFARFETPHPRLVDPKCLADGCPDWITFHWSGVDAFDVLIRSMEPLKFQLLEVTGKVIAEAVDAKPVDWGVFEADALPNVHPDLVDPLADPDLQLIPTNPFDGALDIGSILPEPLAGDYVPNDPFGRLNPIPLPIVEPISQRMSMPDLEPGFYVLAVFGEPTTYSLTFVPPTRAPDSDGDGISDAFDPCPEHAEDVDGIGDADGCPEEDEDRDGVPDAFDNCPLVENQGQRDRDGDGVGNRCDACPDTPKKASVDETGCPIDQPGDFDLDGDVDLADWVAFQACFQGPGQPFGKGCAGGDIDGDSDVDLSDLIAFQHAFNGAR